MGTTLQNGLYLPNEGEKNCYAGLKLNWETLDAKIADIIALQQAVTGALHREIVATLPTTDIDTATIYMILNGTSATENIYDEYMYISNAWELIGTSATDLTNYYTKAEVDGKLLLKANASDLTSHTGDTTIHVTASDKAKWDTVALIKQLRLVNTQVGSATTIAFANIDDTNGIKVGDKCMDLDAKLFEITAVDATNETVTVGSALIDIALDANVMHLSGNENVNGIKNFKDIILIDGDYIGNEASTNQRTNICLRANRDTADKSGAYITRFRQNRSQGDLQTGDLQMIGFDVLENEVRTNNVFSIQCTDWLNDVPQRVNMVCGAQSYSYGNSARKALFNDLNPGSLSLPNLDNGLDISGYITAGNTHNEYTPIADGWISVIIKKTTTSGALAIFLYQGDMGSSYFGNTSLPDSTEFCGMASIPVKAGTVVNIDLKGSNNYVYSAKFYPCLGNI